MDSSSSRTGVGCANDGDGDNGPTLVTPGIEDAEALQGFERGWTAPAMTNLKNGPRWKLVGNAVTVGVARWLVDRLHAPGSVVVQNREVRSLDRWPDAAYGEGGRIRVFEASAWPLRHDYRHLLDLLAPSESAPLSHRAASGFLERASRSRLKFLPAFLADLKEHIVFMRGDPSPESKSTPARRLDTGRTQHAVD